MIRFTLKNLDNASSALSILTGSKNLYSVRPCSLNNALIRADFKADLHLWYVYVEGMIVFAIGHGSNF